MSVSVSTTNILSLHAMIGEQEKLRADADTSIKHLTTLRNTQVMEHAGCPVGGLIKDHKGRTLKVRKADITVRNGVFWVTTLYASPPNDDGTFSERQEWLTKWTPYTPEV